MGYEPRGRDDGAQGTANQMLHGKKELSLSQIIVTSSRVKIVKPRLESMNLAHLSRS
jgi:hypothetical protein